MFTSLPTARPPRVSIRAVYVAWPLDVEVRTPPQVRASRGEDLEVRGNGGDEGRNSGGDGEARREHGESKRDVAKTSRKDRQERDKARGGERLRGTENWSLCSCTEVRRGPCHWEVFGPRKHPLAASADREARGRSHLCTAVISSSEQQEKTRRRAAQYQRIFKCTSCGATLAADAYTGAFTATSTSPSNYTASTKTLKTRQVSELVTVFSEEIVLECLSCTLVREFDRSIMRMHDLPDTR